MSQWITICQKQDLTPNAGICAKVNEDQVAVFYCAISDELYGVSNYDPIGKANVLSRGIIGSIDEKVVVASPLYKQHFCLVTGECLEEPSQNLKTFETRIVNNDVQVLAA